MLKQRLSELSVRLDNEQAARQLAAGEAEARCGWVCCAVLIWALLPWALRCVALCCAVLCCAVLCCAVLRWATGREVVVSALWFEVRSANHHSSTHHDQPDTLNTCIATTRLAAAQAAEAKAGTLEAENGSLMRRLLELQVRFGRGSRL